MASEQKKSSAVRFTRLKLNGFKSFVDPTDLVIADGLTGVVGPNGCGKSNLLEALRWVMGENRPTAMRGGGMEDVIFAGTSSRNARNFAEVAIFIDNEERRAPAEFNDSDHLEIVRRITRDAGSAFKLNTKDARARDVQMLFADASTGAHSPALVRQGQISELISAKPRNRRRVLEEAAGISGLYQRRHDAELKLNGAEANLQRIDDVIEQLAAQLAQLARQARQAARYREIGEALREAEGMLLYRRWREADAARASADAELRTRITETSMAERAAQRAGTKRENAEAALPPLREEEAIAAALLQRVSVAKDALAEENARAHAAIDALTAQIAQLGLDITREEALNTDAEETLARLSAEAETLQAEDEGHDIALAAANAAAREAAHRLETREEELNTRNEDVARLAARHQSAERLLNDTRRLAERSAKDATAAQQSLTRTESAFDDASRRFEETSTAQAAAHAHSETAEALLAEADDARAAAQSREAEARAERSEAEGEVAALRAEVAALSRLLDREMSEQGQILDQVRVTPGYEKALGAALADDLRAPSVDPMIGSGWVALPGYAQPQTLPPDVTGLSGFVTVPKPLDRRIGQIGLVDQNSGARLQADLKPGQRLVSVEGDLWRWDGYRAAADDAPSAAALRLQQLNRLEELKHELVRATARMEGASQAHDVLKANLIELTDADRRARDARRAADAKATETSRALSRAEADRNIAGGRVESLRLAVARHGQEAETARDALRDAEAACAALEDLDAARATVGALKNELEAARQTMLARRGAHDELRRAGDRRAKRSAEITKEQETWQKRLTTADARMAELTERRVTAQSELQVAASEPDRIAAEQASLAEQIASAEARRKAAAEALLLAETSLREAAIAERDAERAASEAREGRAAAEARASAALDAQRIATEQIEEAQTLSPEGLLETLKTDPDKMQAAERIEAEVNRLKRQRDALGAVNLRAEEDARAVQTEHDELAQEKADLEEAIRKLRGGIGALNREGRERLLTAFEQVNANFSMLFTHLFGGGEANLVLVESDDPLEAGLEIMCQPPGKKLSTLSLLSGGEQTLTALALIFAVFLANPAPICVLDEVDAPLDDANVTRFCDLLDEMTRRTETRFLIITHHAVTMARMDRLFGVTMAEQGVSQLVSVDLKKAEQLVA